MDSFERDFELYCCLADHAYDLIDDGTARIDLDHEDGDWYVCINEEWVGNAYPSKESAEADLLDAVCEWLRERE